MATNKRMARLLLVVSALLFAHGLAMTILVSQMWIRGSVEVVEPVIWHRSIEVAIAASMAILGLGSFLYTLHMKGRD